MRTEGLGVRAAGRSVGKAHSTTIRWERRGSPAAPEGTDVTLEGDEVYTRVGENLRPSEAQGWTSHFIERESR